MRKDTVGKEDILPHLETWNAVCFGRSWYTAGCCDSLNECRGSEDKEKMI